MIDIDELEPPRLRVMVAEDETIIRLDLKGILERYGLEVCAEARDGQEAVELAHSTRPDVAVLDVKMPRLDGIEAARRILAERPIPIVLLTAFNDRNLVGRAIDAGIFGYLAKPFREGDLIPAIRTAVARHEELISARREIGAKPQKAVELSVIGRDGKTWPLRLGRMPDGSLDVSVTAEEA
jgi:AmiR/NasT family two-component response regulator